MGPLRPQLQALAHEVHLLGSDGQSYPHSALHYAAPVPAAVPQPWDGTYASVTIPTNHPPGESMVIVFNGQHYAVHPPPSLAPGTSFVVQIPSSVVTSSQTYAVTPLQIPSSPPPTQPFVAPSPPHTPCSHAHDTERALLEMLDRERATSESLKQQLARAQQLNTTQREELRNELLREKRSAEHAREAPVYPTSDRAWDRYSESGSPSPMRNFHSATYHSRSSPPPPSPQSRERVYFHIYVGKMGPSGFTNTSGVVRIMLRPDNRLRNLCSYLPNNDAGILCLPSGEQLSLDRTPASYGFLPGIDNLVYLNYYVPNRPLQPPSPSRVSSGRTSKSVKFDISRPSPSTSIHYS